MKRPLLVAVLCGVLATLFTALYLNALEMTYKKGAQKVKVLIAKQYIDQGSMIDETMIEEGTIPKDFIQPKALQAVKELVNQDGRKQFMAVVPIEKGEQLVATKLFMLGLDTGISAITPGDKRAVTLVLDREKVAGIVRPGNRVDVVGVFDYEDKDHHAQEASATVLQNILVLSVGKSFLGALQPLQAGKGTDKPVSIDVPEGRIPVSLALSPQEAELFVLASEKGTINFSLRPIGDDRIVPLQIAKIQDIFKDITTISNERTTGATVSASSLREMQARQREALEILKKYQKN
jgi:pilus assembly protein CpaB